MTQSSPPSAFEDGDFLFASSIKWVAANVFLVSLSPPFSRNISCELSAVDVPRTANPELNRMMQHAVCIVNKSVRVILRQDFYSRYPLEGYGDIFFLPSSAASGNDGGSAVDALPGTLRHPGMWKHCSHHDLKSAGWLSLQEELVRAGAGRIIRPMAVGVDDLFAAEEDMEGCASLRGALAECKCSWGRTMATWEKSVRMSQTWVGTVTDILRGDAFCIHWDEGCGAETPSALRTEFQPSLVLLDGVRCEAANTSLGYSAVRAVQRVALQRRVRVQVRSVNPADKDIANNTQMTEFELLAHVRGCVELLPMDEASATATPIITGDIGRWLLRHQLGKMHPVGHASMPRCHTFHALIRDIKTYTEEINRGGNDGYETAPLSLLEVWRRFLWGGDVLDNRAITLPETHVHNPLHFLHSLQLPLFSAGIAVGVLRSASLEVSAAPHHSRPSHRRFLRMEVELLFERQRACNAGRRDRTMNRGLGEVVFTPEPTMVRYGTMLTVTATYNPQLSGMRESCAHITLTSKNYDAGQYNPSLHTVMPRTEEASQLPIPIPQGKAAVDIVVDAVVRFDGHRETLTARAVYRAQGLQAERSLAATEEINMDAEIDNTINERIRNEDVPPNEMGQEEEGGEEEDGSGEGSQDARNKAEDTGDALLDDAHSELEEVQRPAIDTAFFHSLVDFYFELPPYDVTDEDVRGNQIGYSLQREPWLADLLQRVRALQYADVCAVPAGLITVNNRRGYIGDLHFLDCSTVTQHCSAAVTSAIADKVTSWGYPWDTVSSFDQPIQPFPTKLPLSSFVHDIGRSWWRTTAASSHTEFLSNVGEMQPSDTPVDDTDPEALLGVDVRRALAARDDAVLLILQKEEGTHRKQVEMEEAAHYHPIMLRWKEKLPIGSPSSSSPKDATVVSESDEITVAPWWVDIRIGKESLWVDTDCAAPLGKDGAGQKQLSTSSPYLAFAPSSIPQTIPLFAFSIFPRQFFSAHTNGHKTVIRQPEPENTAQYSLGHVDAAFMRLRFSRLPNFFAMNLERLPLTLHNAERAYCGYAQRVELQKRLHPAAIGADSPLPLPDTPTAALGGRGSHTPSLYAAESVLARLLSMLLRLTPKNEECSTNELFSPMKPKFKVSNASVFTEAVLYRLTDAPPRAFFLGTRDSIISDLFEGDQALCMKLPHGVTSAIISQLGMETLLEGNGEANASHANQSTGAISVPFAGIPLTSSASPDCVPMGKLNIVPKVPSSEWSPACGTDSTQCIRPHIRDHSKARHVVYHPLPWLSVIGTPLAVRDEVDLTVPHSASPDATLPVARRHIGVKCQVLRLPKSKPYQFFSYGQASRAAVFELQEKMTFNGSDIVDYFSLLLRRPSTAMRDTPFPDGLMRVYTVPMEPLFMHYIARRALRFEAALFWGFLRTDADIPQVEKYLSLVPLDTSTLNGDSQPPATQTTFIDSLSTSTPGMEAIWNAEADDGGQESNEYARDLAYVQGGVRLDNQHESTQEKAIWRARQVIASRAAAERKSHQEDGAGAIAVSDAAEADVLVRLCRVVKGLVHTIAKKLYPGEGESQSTSTDKPASGFPYSAFDRCYLGCHFSEVGDVARLIISLYPVSNDSDNGIKLTKATGARSGDFPASDEKEPVNPHRAFIKDKIVYGRMWAHQMEVTFTRNQFVWRWID